MRAHAVDAGEKRKEPFWDCSLRSLFQSTSLCRPSSECNRVVGYLCTISMGILHNYTSDEVLHFSGILPTGWNNSQVLHSSNWHIRISDQTTLEMAIIFKTDRSLYEMTYFFNFFSLSVEICCRIGALYGKSSPSTLASSSIAGNTTSNPIGI